MLDLAGPDRWRRSLDTFISLAQELRLLVYGGSDCLLIDPLAASTKPQALDEPAVENLEMYGRATKGSKAKVPHPHKDLSQASSQLAGVGLK